MRSRYFKRAGLAMLFAVFSLAAVHADKQQADEQVANVAVDAVWQEHEERFTYHSFATYYSCTGLEDSVERLLEELGAKDVKARASGCGINDIERTIPVRVKFKSLTTESNVQGEKVKAKFIDTDFSEIYRRRSVRDGQGRCDLVRAVSKSLSDVLELETLKKQSICNSGYSSGNDVKWKVKVLKPVS